MAKIGRNEPCPCGSGSKYKRCCLGAPVAAELAATTAQALAEAHEELCPFCVDELNERADHVLDLLLAGAPMRRRPCGRPLSGTFRGRPRASTCSR